MKTGEYSGILGSHKEVEGIGGFVVRVKRDPSGLYVEIPSNLRNRLEIIEGDRLLCLLRGTVDEDGNLLEKIEQEVIWKVEGYWNELRIPSEDSRIFEIGKEDNIQLVPIELIRGKEKPDP